MKGLVALPLLAGVLLSLLGLAGCAKTMLEPQAFPDPVLDRVATSYYGQVEMASAKWQEQEAQYKQSLNAGTRPPPAAANGRVVDRKGGPIAGAAVVIQSRSADDMLGQCVTDKDGRFAISLMKPTSDRQPELSIIVTHQGQARWAQRGSFPGVLVRMDRDIVPAYLGAVTTQADPEERLWMLLEIVGSRQMVLDVERLYPAIGTLRPDLLQVIRSGKFAIKDDKRSSPADRARAFLEFWHDPADAELFSSVPPSVAISGKTIQEACKRWEDHYFAKAQGQRPMSSFSEPIVGADKKHGLVTFSVIYAHWGYSMRLVLLYDGRAWNLVMVQKHAHWDE